MEEAVGIKPRPIKGLLCFWSSIKNGIEKAGKFLCSKPLAVIISLVVAGGVFGFASHGMAQIDLLASILTGDAALQTALSAVAGFICTVLYMIASLIVFVNVLLMHALISVVQYNVFVAARPVELGWPLVRDVVNMFFIVVLLAIAFGTIVGYEEFHYKKHLPKLLLMAVMINFSKTLVGLLIDFSQVVTLTFVNGFKQAAFGNLVKGFHITEILSVVTEAPEGEILRSLGKIMMSLVFAITICSIIATVLLIMLIYFAVRIVMLWILLILSPFAFFALALPSKLQKAMSALTQDWWKQLGAWLTGGPVVAFFLWLALATIQSATDPFAGIYVGEAEEPTAGGELINQIASTKNITSLLIGIVLLLGGLKIAVQVSGEASAKLGQIAGKIKAAGGPAGWAGGLAARGAKGAARVGGKVVKAGAKIGLAAAQAKYGGQIGAAGGKVVAMAGKLKAQGGAAGVLGGVVEKGGLALSAVPGKVAAQEKAKQDERLKNQNVDTQRIIAEGDLKRGQKEGNTALESVSAMKLAQLALNPADQASRKKEALDKAQAYRPRQGVGESNDAFAKRQEDFELQAESFADTEVRRKVAEDRAAGKKAAKALGDTDMLTKFSDDEKKDPSLMSDQQDINKLMAEKIGEPARLLREMKVNSFQDTGVMTAYLQAARLLDDKGKLKEGYEDSDAWQEMIKNPTRGKYAEAFVQKMDTTNGAKEIANIIQAGRAGASDAEKAAGYNSRSVVSPTTDGRSVFSNLAGDVSKSQILGGKVEIKSMDELISKLDAVRQASLKTELTTAGITGSKEKAFVQGFSGYMSNDQADHVTANVNTYASDYSKASSRMAAGAVATEALAKGQAMGINVPTGGQQMVMNYVTANINTQTESQKAQNAKIIANTNTKVLEQPGPDRDALIASLTGKMDAMGELYKAGDKESQKKIENAIKDINKAAANVRATAASGVKVSSADEALMEIGKEIQNQRALSRIGGRK